jgi:hypothetical protein
LCRSHRFERGVGSAPDKLYRRWIARCSTAITSTTFAQALEELLGSDSAHVGVLVGVRRGGDIAVVAALDPFDDDTDDYDEEEASEGAKHCDENHEDEAVTTI